MNYQLKNRTFRNQAGSLVSIFLLKCLEMDNRSNPRNGAKAIPMNGAYLLNQSISKA